MSPNDDSDSGSDKPLDADLKIASYMPESCVKQYRGGRVYIFDDCDRSGEEPRVHRSAEFVRHEINCELIREFFTNHTKYEVNSVRFTTSGFRQSQFMKWWKEELASLSRDELVFVYFHGRSAYRGLNYRWQFYTRPASIDVHHLFHITNNSGRDCMYILDCPMPTRFREIPKRERGGHSDFTAAGPVMLDEKGNPLHDFAYTERLCEYLGNWCKTVRRTTWKSNYRFTRLSLPMILGRDSKLSSSPLRIWESKTAPNKTGLVYRFCLIPERVQATRRLDWVRVRTQGSAKREREAEQQADDDVEIGDPAEPDEDDPAADGNTDSSSTRSQPADDDRDVSSEQTTPLSTRDSIGPDGFMPANIERWQKKIRNDLSLRSEPPYTVDPTGDDDDVVFLGQRTTIGYGRDGFLKAEQIKQEEWTAVPPRWPQVVIDLDEDTWTEQVQSPSLIDLSG